VWQHQKIGKKRKERKTPWLVSSISVGHLPYSLFNEIVFHEPTSAEWQGV
jgi:hypothetical protein